MKRSIKFRSLSVLLFLIASLLWGCTDDLLKSIEEEVNDKLSGEETQMMTLSLSFADSDIDTRLQYEEISQGDGRAMLTKWAADDKIFLTLSPGNPETVGYSSELSLQSGAGTGKGVFTGTSINYISENWFVYFPCDKVGGEKDFLSFSYTGQTQNGNNSTAHLKDYHTLRYHYTSANAVQLNGNNIDLSGDDVVQSACIKFNLSNLEQIVPTNISLEYYNPSGSAESVFYIYNYLSVYYPDSQKSFSPNSSRSYKMDLALQNFTETTSVTAYLVTSNAEVTLSAGGKLRVVVTASNGNKYYCDKQLGTNIKLVGGTMNSISCSNWEQLSGVDGMVNASEGVKVLQEKSKGAGIDIIIMGDGYAEDNFSNGVYDSHMSRAYNDFFHAEPLKSLKPYFNVYYINAVSEENHDATPLQNGAVQGDAKTVFNTQFVQNSTQISGNDELAVQYAMQAIRAKGGAGGTSCADENEVYARAHKALILVMVNVECHAGTCYMRWTTATDYANAYSVAYTSLNTSDFGRRWTMLHEAGGHGYGKLADEYVSLKITEFRTNDWLILDNNHSYGVFRNVDRYWGASYPGDATVVWNGVTEAENVITTVENVYWSDLVTDYSSKEGLGVWESANGYVNFYCRATENSVMNNQFSQNGQFFNAISRWAIWYRTMRLAGEDVGSDFFSSLGEFKNFDKNLNIVQSEQVAAVASIYENTVPYEPLQPLAPPVLLQGEWVNGRFMEK